MKPGAMLGNSSRGGLIATDAVIAALKSRKLGALAIDVYEHEGALFYHDRSTDIIDDEVFQRLMTFPNVLVSGHQGFFTTEALTQIAEVTLRNMECFVSGTECSNRLHGKDGPSPASQFYLRQGFVSKCQLAVRLSYRMELDVG